MARSPVLFAPEEAAMMDIEVMRQIVDVIESGALPDVATLAMSRWDGHALSYVRSSANYVFRFLRGERPCFLRLSPAAERTVPQMEAELAFVRHVAAHGVAVARPLPSRRGVLIETLKADRQPYHVVAFVGLQGDEFEAEELDAAQMRAWGATLARLHMASQTFPPQPARSPWQHELRAAREALPPNERAAMQVLDAGIAWLDTLMVSPGEYGLLHGDFELDNLVWDGRQWQALDFDGAVYSWHAVDIAIALQDVWARTDAGRTEAIESFYAGYTAVRPLPAGLREATSRILALVTAAKMGQLHRAYANTRIDERSPEWLVTMYGRHKRWLAAKRESLRWP
jgi:Ser/Thr protein kinase RdoA (MazF antagonist)